MESSFQLLQVPAKYSSLIHLQSVPPIISYPFFQNDTGILEVRRGSGTYVIRTSPFDEDPLGLSKLQDKYKLALELFEVRLMLEPEIALQAAIS